MFRIKKIRLNHLRASRSNFIKSNNFLKQLSFDIMDRANLNKKKNYDILELWARSNHLYDLIKTRKFKVNYYHTLSDKSIKVKNIKKVVSSIDPPFKDNSFDFCFSILSISSAEDIVKTFNKIHNLLKKGGKFICVLNAEDNLKEFKNNLFNSFPKISEKSFLPFIDILSLGKIGKIAGFKNIVIDKSNFLLEVQVANEIWNFIRNIGESNILENRENLFLGKNNYLSYCQKMRTAIIKKNCINTLSVNFFTGSK